MNILLFSNFELPDSCANATRVISFAKMLKECGHNVELCGVCYDKGKELEGQYDGIPYEMILANNYSGLKAYKRINELTRSIKRYLASKNSEIKIDAIMISNIYYDNSKVFLCFAKQNNIPLIVNAVEWYDFHNELFTGITGKIKYLKNRIALKVIYPKIKNIIGISDLLSSYYQKRGCNTITIPTILDMQEYDMPSKEINNKVIIAYAGSPGKKDCIKNAVLALDMLDNDELKRVEIHIYGVTKSYFTTIGVTEKFLNKYSKSLFIHGRIPYDEVKQKIAEADFSVLLRPNKRYANAGFPTKVGESMACGTPVIANVTSDLGKYIVDGKTGIICGDQSVQACTKAYKKALKLTNEREKMQKFTKEMAYDSFDYRAYISKMSEYVTNLKGFQK